MTDIIELIDEYAETRHRCGCATYNAKTEAARKAVIKALGGVQALSAAPAVLHEPTNEMYRAAQKIALPYDDDDGGTIILNTSQIRAIWHAMLAASPTPTPQTEQQAAPKAAPGESGWWRKRADEIEGQVALTGSPEAMRCYTDMRTLLQAAAGAAPQQEPAHPACKSDMLVNGGALVLAIAVLRRAGKTEVADELAKTAQPAPAPLSDDTERLREALQRIEGASMSMYATRSDMLEHCQDIARAALAAQGDTP